MFGAGGVGCLGLPAYLSLKNVSVSFPCKKNWVLGLKEIENFGQRV